MAEIAPFRPYWQRAFGLPATIEAEVAGRMVDLLAPWLGRCLARAPVADLVAEDAGVEAAEAAFRRLALARQAATLAALQDGGPSVLPIKGFDAAFRLYDPPWLRVLGDLDLLVGTADLGRAVGALENLGFAVEESPQGALGLTSDVSFHPLVSADGLVSVDLHTALDAFPLSAALDAEAVFAAAVDTPGGRQIAAEHAALAALSNLAKERFGPYALRHLIDLGRLAVGAPLDWKAVDRVVRQAGLDPARTTACGALRRLGVPAESLPADLDPNDGAARRLAAILDTGIPANPGRLAKIRREIGWCYTPAALARIWRFRAAGLIRRRSGRPPAAGGIADGGA